MCLAQGHNTVTPVRFEPAALRSRVKHSTTEPLRSLPNVMLNKENGNSEHIVKKSTFGERVKQVN